MKHKAYFKKWYDHMKKWEGRLNHVVALQGEGGVYTNQGIQETTWNMLAPRLLNIPQHELASRFRNMKPSEHETIAKDFWNRGGGDRFKDGRVAAFMAEAFWGGGAGALRHYQRWFSQRYNISMAADGIVGNITATAFNSVNQDALYSALLAEMRARYARLRNAHLYLRGWLNRLNDFEQLFEKKTETDLQELCRCPSCGASLRLQLVQ